MKPRDRVFFVESVASSMGLDPTLRVRGGRLSADFTVYATLDLLAARGEYSWPTGRFGDVEVMEARRVLRRHVPEFAGNGGGFEPIAPKPLQLGGTPGTPGLSLRQRATIDPEAVREEIANSPTLRRTHADLLVQLTPKSGPKSRQDLIDAGFPEAGGQLSVSSAPKPLAFEPGQTVSAEEIGERLDEARRDADLEQIRREAAEAAKERAKQ